MYDTIWSASLESTRAWTCCSATENTSEPTQKPANTAGRPKTRTITASENQDHSYELVSKGPGVLDNLTLREVPRRAPGPGEIEIQVSVAALNFLDVLKALGMAPGLPDGPLCFGMECSGRVVRVGEGVEGLQVGDFVFARDETSSGCLREFLTTSAGSVLRKPEHLSLEEAATIPVAYMTAHYSLHHLARLRKGESVLIHSAAGGVGLAALEIALLSGLRHGLFTFLDATIVYLPKPNDIGFYMCVSEIGFVSQKTCFPQASLDTANCSPRQR